MRPFGRLIPMEEAVRRTLAAVRPVTATESVALADALGRPSAETVRAPRDVPEHARATWDGYALRSRGTRGAAASQPVALRLVGEVFAEGRLARRLGVGETAAIATGGALPPGSDAVIPFEEVEEHRDSITLHRSVRIGERVAEPGSDFRRGTLLVSTGETLDAARLGALGATGRSATRVRRRPRVVLVPNGNELLPPGAPPREGAVYEINNLTLGALARSAGCEVTALPPVRDDERTLERVIRRAAATADLVIVSGGSSVGERDYLPTIFPRLGRLLYHGVAVRPGKPTLAARTRASLLLGMPGHPTSCLCNGFWLLLPTLRKLAGLAGPGWLDGSATLAAPVLRPSATLATVVPLRVEGEEARPTFRDSSAITSLAGANAFAVLARGSRPPRVGQRIAVHRLLPPVAVA